MYVKLINVLYPYLYTAFRKRHVVECQTDAQGSETCLPGLAKDLMKYFGIHTMICIMKILGFSWLGRWKMNEEMARVKADGKLKTKTYSYVEVQAKLMPAPGITDEYLAFYLTKREGGREGGESARSRKKN